MARILSTPHAHTTYVDGKSTAEEMVLAALDAGFHSIGLSEHGTQAIDRFYGLMPDDVPRYTAEVHALREKYKGQIRVHLGIERDMYSSARREDYEYVIGSLHYIVRGETFYAADGELEPLVECRDRYFGGDGAALAREYFEHLARYAEEYRPDILGHFDLIRKRNPTGALYDPDDPALLKTEYEALEAIWQSGAMLELNTGGMARGYLTTPYPELRMLKFWHDLGGRVIVGSDSHHTSTIDYAFDQMPDFLRAAGFQTFWELGAEGEAQFVERALD